MEVRAADLHMSLFFYTLFAYRALYNRLKMTSRLGSRGTDTKKGHLKDILLTLLKLERVHVLQ